MRRFIQPVVLSLLMLWVACSLLRAQVQIVEAINDCQEGYIGKWSVADKKFKCLTPLLTSAGNPGDVPISNGTAFVPGPPPSGGVPAGLITMTLTSCPAGWSEAAALDGVTLVGTLAAHADVGTTGGSDSVTPTVNSLTAAAQTFTGSALGTHSHGVGTYVNSNSAVSGIVVDAHASHTHTYTQVVNHTHQQTTNNATTGSTGTGVGAAVDTSTSGGPSTVWFSTLDPAGGVATGTTAGPSASLTHNVSNNGTAAAQTISGSSESVSAGTPAGSNSTSAVTGTLNAFDNRSAFVKVIFCSKD